MVDTSVFAPERPIFEPLPVLRGDLRQARPPVVFSPGTDLDTRLLLDPSDDELLRYNELLRAAKLEVLQTAEAKKRRRVAAVRFAKRIRLQHDPDTGAPYSGAAASRQAERALVEVSDFAGVLSGGFLLEFNDGATATVDAVIANPDGFRDKTLADPLEPDYGGGGNKAKLFENPDRSLVIHSFEHGGRNFLLERDLSTVGAAIATLRVPRDAPPEPPIPATSSKSVGVPQALAVDRELLANPPGLIGQIADFADSRTIRETRYFSVATALLAVSALTQNRFVLTVPDGGPLSSLNLFMVLVAASGVGKEAPQKTLQFLLAVVGMEEIELDPASEQGLMRRLASNPAALVVYDEFGRHLTAMQSPTGGHAYALMTAYMKLFGKAFGRTAERVYANKKDNIPAVNRPYVVLLGLSTKEHLAEAMSNSDIVDGTLNRLLMVEEPDPDPPFRNGAAKERPSAEVVAALTWLSSQPDPRWAKLAAPSESAAGPPSLENRPQVWTGEIHLAVDAHTALIQFRSDASALRVRAGDHGPLYVRAYENALRVTGCLAAADAALDPEHRLVASLLHARYAINFVLWSIELQARSLVPDLSTTARNMPEKVLAAMWSWLDRPSGKFSEVNRRG